MHVTELLDILKLQGIPHKEAVRQARAMLKEQERIRELNAVKMRAGRKAVKPKPSYGGWGNGR
jgi:DNA repair protein RadC